LLFILERIHCQASFLPLNEQVENVVLEIPMPRAVLNCSLTPTQGKYSFDPVTRTLVWDVGRIDTSRLPNIRGTVIFLLFQSLLPSHSFPQQYL